MSIGVYIAPIIILLWIILVVYKKGIRKPTNFHILLFLYIFWGGMSIIWTVNIITTLVEFFIIFGGGMLALILWDLIRKEWEFKIAALSYIMGCFVLLVVEWYYFLSLGSFRLGRPDGLLSPLTLSGNLVFGLPLAWYLVTENDSIRYLSKWEYISYPYLFIGSLSVLLTESRQAVIMLSIFLAFITMYHLSNGFAARKRFLQLIMSGTIALSLLILSFDINITKAIPFEDLRESLDFITGGSSADEARLDTRLWIYQTGLDLIQSNPVGGTGLGTFREAAYHEIGGRGAHSTVLYVASETGLIGFVLFVLAMLTLAKNSLNVIDSRHFMGFVLISILLARSLVESRYITITNIVVFTMILLATKAKYDD